MKTRVLPLLVGLVVFATLVLFSTHAFAQGVADTADAPTWLTQVTDALVEILVPILIGVLLLGVRKGFKVFEAKAKIDIPDAQEQQIERWVELGIHWAEEQAHRRLKEQTQTVSGSEKLDMAAQMVLGLARERGWIDWTREKIETKIEGRLGKLRAADEKPASTEPAAGA